ncbi:MAG: hypothetical protein QNJ84_11395 [Alphaproteobacteria bacterium]|nr:hypothetical protein [Alphaproteobacteria bacterium]
MAHRSGGGRDRFGQILRLVGETGTGALICLERRLARSPAASIYSTDRVGVAAKIYHRPAPNQRLKLEAMMRSRPPDPSLRPCHVSFAWPSAILVDGSDQFVGFIMPLAEARAVEAVQVAARCAAADHLNFLMTHLHRFGEALDGVTARDVAVDRRGLVTLTGCDRWWDPKGAVTKRRRLLRPCLSALLASAPTGIPGAAASPEPSLNAALRFELALARGDARLALALWRADPDLRRHEDAPDHVVRMRELGAAIDTIDALLDATPLRLTERLQPADLAALWRGLFYDHPILRLLSDEPPQDPARQHAARQLSAALAHARRESAPLQEAHVIGQGGRRRIATPSARSTPVPRVERRPVGPLLAAPAPVRFIKPTHLSAASDGGPFTGSEGENAPHLTYSLSVETEETAAPMPAEGDWTRIRERALADAFREPLRRVILVITPSQAAQTPPIAVVNRATGAVIAECDGLSGAGPVTIRFDAPTQPVTLALEYRRREGVVDITGPQILHPPVKQRMVGPPAARPVKGARTIGFAQI